ncbi:MAG: peptide chain release factor N(5)-glutamine methyltransferase [Planctomycetota bacterium]
MTTTEEWTILRLLKWTESYLTESGSDSPRLDAEILLATAKECDRIQLYTSFDEVATDEVRTAYRELVRRRAEGAPVAYLVGHREFFSRRFRVNENVLIPRPETEFVVTQLCDCVADRQQQVSIVDVGTGSGILAITAALELPNAKVTAIDISDGALEVARQNAEDHGVLDRIDFVEGDLLDSISTDTKFDFVLSNPPYVSESEFEELDTQVKDHEPKLALVAGEFGTSVIERLIPQAADRLVTGGRLMMEISPMIEERVHGLIQSHGGFETPSTTKDLAQLARVVTATRTAP